MNADLFLVVGLVLGAFSIPPILGALADGRAPRAAAITIMVAGGLIALAISQKPEGYDLADIPNVFVRVIGKYLN